jgi:hypothetical protein
MGISFHTLLDKASLSLNLCHDPADEQHVCYYTNYLKTSLPSPPIYKVLLHIQLNRVGALEYFMPCLLPYSTELGRGDYIR